MNERTKFRGRGELSSPMGPRALRWINERGPGIRAGARTKNFERSQSAAPGERNPVHRGPLTGARSTPRPRGGPVKVSRGGGMLCVDGCNSNGLYPGGVWGMRSKWVATSAGCRFANNLGRKWAHGYFHSTTCNARYRPLPSPDS